MSCPNLCCFPAPPPRPGPFSHAVRGFANFFHSAGGVVIVGSKGKIEIDNTLETRLKLLEDSAAPAVRETLFGKNANRKFYD